MTVIPASQRVESGVLPVGLRKSTTTGNLKDRPNPRLASDWDPWPDGAMKLDFTWPEFEATGQLMSHWAAKVGGGDRRGVSSAEVWEMGK